MAETADEKQAPSPTASGGGGGAEGSGTGEARNNGTPRPSSKPAKALIGSTISDRYRIERLLGEGGMGAVYQAEHTLMRKRMAIKVLHPEMTRLPEVVARFEREAMAAAHIDHPHVVTATDFGKLDDGAFFLALEYVEGKSLREVIAQGKLDLGRALHISRQIAAALSRAHALKIVHRDLKPENVMLVEREGDPDFVKVLDFGIAKVQIGELTAADVSQPASPGQPVLTQAGMVYGTPEYMAPEQALGQPVDPRADLYALGVITYEMLTGVRPFDADSKVALLGMQVTAPVPPMVKKNPDANVPPEVEALVNRLLAKESSERLGDARELIDGIIQISNALVMNGRIDGRYATSGPGSGIGTSHPIITGFGPAPEMAPSSLGHGAQKVGSTPPKAAEGFLTGKAWIIAAAGGLVGILVLVVTIVVVLKGRNPTAEGNEGGEAPAFDGGPTEGPSVEARIKDAIEQIDRGDYGSGIKTLESLGPEAQAREDVHRALWKAYSLTGRPKDELREARAVLKTNPDFASEGKLREHVRNAALREPEDPASADKELAEIAFTMLKGEMGTEGWDILYDIAYGSSGVNFKPAQKRAKEIISAGDRTKMSAALAVTLDLQGMGGSCQGIKSLLDRAVAKGDVRTLTHLRTLEAPRMEGRGGMFGGGAKDSLACIHKDGSLRRAIAELDARLRAKK